MVRGRGNREMKLDAAFDVLPAPSDGSRAGGLAQTRDVPLGRALGRPLGKPDFDQEPRLNQLG